LIILVKIWAVIILMRH